jgi:hypothetical protein
MIRPGRRRSIGDGDMRWFWGGIGGGVCEFVKFIKFIKFIKFVKFVKFVKLRARALERGKSKNFGTR